MKISRSESQVVHLKLYKNRRGIIINKRVQKRISSIKKILEIDDILS